MACHRGNNGNEYNEVYDQSFCFGAKSFSQMNSLMVIKIAIVATVTVGGMAALSHLTHRDMGNATMVSGTSLAM
ncbi:hypothetical protein [Shewanella xiamenensis]|nr:hypothetical protein [Shewanella xiamenensis]